MAAVSQHAMRRHPGGPLDPSPSFGSPYFAIAHQQVSKIFCGKCNGNETVVNVHSSDTLCKLCLLCRLTDLIQSYWANLHKGFFSKSGYVLFLCSFRCSFDWTKRSQSYSEFSFCLILARCAIHRQHFHSLFPTLVLYLQSL